VVRNCHAGCNDIRTIAASLRVPLTEYKVVIATALIDAPVEHTRQTAASFDFNKSFALALGRPKFELYRHAAGDEVIDASTTARALLRERCRSEGHMWPLDHIKSAQHGARS
jgi:hypothetical protein